MLSSNINLINTSPLTSGGELWRWGSSGLVGLLTKMV